MEWLQLRLDCHATTVRPCDLRSTPVQRVQVSNGRIIGPRSNSSRVADVTAALTVNISGVRFTKDLKIYLKIVLSLS